MNRITMIKKEIDINKKHIDEFILEKDTGTKKMRESFYKNAVLQRNAYISNQLEKFQVAKMQVYKTMKNRVDKYFPIDKGSIYIDAKKEIDNIKNVVKCNNPFSDNNYKLGFLSMISKIKEDTEVSLDSVNAILSDFIKKFNEIGINLTMEDFSYSIFIYSYMKNFFSKDNVTLKETFEAIYWECPDFLKHLKLNLWFILDKYKKEIDSHMEVFKNNQLRDINISSEGLLDTYYSKKTNLNISIMRDEYINLNNFLDKKRLISDYLEGSSIRKNNFNVFALNSDFDSLDDVAKSKYYLEVYDLSNTLDVLKKYYRYEFIIKDLQGKFQKISENKNLYENKLKEIKKEEANRNKIFNRYLRSCGIGFLAKRDERKISSLKLEMNEEVLKLFNLYSELHELDIIYKMNKHVSNVSSLYDLFMVAYSSYFYLEKAFNDNFKDIDNFSFDEEMDEYFDFLYNPNSSFLSKINAFANYSISNVIADKYNLLGLKVDLESISKDNIDSTLDTINFIKLIRDIDASNLSLLDMNFIVKFSEFDIVDFSVLNDDDLDLL